MTGQFMVSHVRGGEGSRREVGLVVDIQHVE
jgi:hypothetical protein